MLFYHSNSELVRLISDFTSWSIILSFVFNSFCKWSICLLYLTDNVCANSSHWDFKMIKFAVKYFFIVIKQILQNIFFKTFEFFILCHSGYVFFSEEFVSAFSMVFFAGFTRPIVKSEMFFVFDISESFKGVWGVIEESGVELLFG